MEEKKMSFEEAMDALEQIVARLESGEETLEESLKLFEEGAALSAQCYDRLKKAEQKIEKLKLTEGTD